ncbi:hypothetical protein HK405_001763 [Cladochytrium tenue]|nr:hypothetical protein HK405_001763 [Cladochytrium tenue]
MLFPGAGQPPTISTQRPSASSVRPTSKGGKASAGTVASLPVVVVEIEDSDILNFVTGGLHGLRAFVSGRIRVLGDHQVALQLEEVFNKAGGVEKAMKFLREHNIAVGKEQSPSKL